MTRTKSTTRTASTRRSTSPKTAVKRALRSTLRSRSKTPRSSKSLISGLPGWVPISLGVAGVCGLVYGLMKLDIVSGFMNPMIHDVGEFFGLTEDEGIDTRNLTHDRIYSNVGA